MGTNLEELFERKKSRRFNILSHLKTAQRVRARNDAINRERESVKQGILDQPRMNQMKKQQDIGFFDLMKTSLGNEISPQGLLRQITPEDLEVLAKKARGLLGKYRGGILPSQVINAALPIDRQRASTEIPWAHPTHARYIPQSGSLVVSFTTAASGKYKEKSHFVTVEFCEFHSITGYFLAPDAPKTQAQEDVKRLKNSLIKFNCDCGRHTYWYRFIASVGNFAYIGTNPLGRKEGGFPKIRNPQLKGIACKHVLRTMQALNSKGTYDFLMKAVLKQYKTADAEKTISIKTTTRDLAASIKRQNKAQAQNEILSDKEQRLNAKLKSRYQQALTSGLLMRNPRDKRTSAQKLAALAKIHGVEDYLSLI